MSEFKVGDRVVINDYSDAHGDKGIIDTIQENGIILIELVEYGCICVVEEDEIVKEEAVCLKLK
jgi:G3E family GTPase